MTVNKIHSFPSETVSQIFCLDNRRLILKDLCIVVAGRARVEETVELIETPLYRMKVKRLAQMLFADRSADVARRL